MELETTTKVPVERLRLDRRNPRLHGEDEKASDEAIIARLYRSAGLDELLQPISANGYMDIEPLIVVLRPRHRQWRPDCPRREPAACSVAPCCANRVWPAGSRRHKGLPIMVPRIDESLRATLDHVSVYPVASRERVRPLIGFKHINGPAKWDAYTKARFAAEWYKAGRGRGHRSG